MKFLSFLIIPLLLTSCTTVNFSSKYYTLPANYKSDIEEVWQSIIKSQVNDYSSISTSGSLKYKSLYSYKITKDNETSVPGIPQIHGYAVSIPDYFIRYVYEFYYPKYHKQILTCVILHELAHTEGNINTTPPTEHYRCDKYAMDNLLPSTSYSTDDFYSSIIVVKNYWSARKGTGGHLFNATYNLAVAWYGGVFMDMYATDIKSRLSLLKHDYPKAKFIYQRTK